MTTDSFQRKLTAILSADVVGYSRLMSEDEAATVKTLETYKGVMFSLIKQHRGRIVDSPGDNLLAEFGSVVDAVQCAVSIQKELQSRNAELPENRRMEFRIGINLGDVIEEDDRIYGDGVNIAARLEGMAEPGGIYISRNVFDQVRTKLDLGYKYLGVHNVKNISEPVRIYRVLIGDEFAGKVIGEKKARRRISDKIIQIQDYSGYKRAVIYSVILILLLMAGAVLVYQHRTLQNKLPSRIDLAILPFQTDNLTGDSIAFARGLIVNIITQLTKLAGQHPLQVVCASEIREKNIHTVQEAIHEFGVNLVMEGYLQQYGKQLRINYSIVNAKTKRTLRSDIITASISNPIELMESVVTSVLSNLGVDLLPDEKGSIGTRTTQRPEAYNYYVTAVGYLQDYHKSENVQTAIRLLQDALKRDTEYADAYAALGEARWLQYKHEKETKRVKEAQSACNRALELDSNLMSGHVCLGVVFTGTGKYEEAVEEFKRALDLEPRSDEAWRGLGSAYKKLGMFKEAEGTYRRAIKEKPKYWAGYFELGNLYADQGRFIEAAEQFLEVTNLVPENHIGYSNLGCVYLLEGRYSDAIQELEHSVGIRPTEMAFSNLGTAYFFLKRFSDASTAYEKAIGFNERDYMIWGNLGEAYYWDPANRARAGEAFRKALTLAKQKLQVNPRNTRLLTFMAYYHAMLDDSEAAQNCLKQVLAMNPQNPEIFFYLAQTYYQLGNTDQTLHWLNKALVAGLSKENIQNTPLFDTLQSNQGFQDMLQNY